MFKVYSIFRDKYKYMSNNHLAKKANFKTCSDTCSKTFNEHNKIKNLINFKLLKFNKMKHYFIISP